MSSFNEQLLSDIANKLRIHSIESTTQSNSGHPSSCASIAEIMSVLFFNEMKYHVSDPQNPANDRFVLSKGHAAPILYAAWAQAGLFAPQELLNLRKWDSTLDGHPTPSLSFVDVATGSLGQGLSCAAGMAYTAKHFDKADYRVYCIIGDGESAEGSIWEAMAFASYYKLNNLVNFIDCNRFGQSQETPYEHHLDVYKNRAEAFGWHAIVVDGHSVKELVQALNEARSVTDKPTCIIAKTFKGKNIPEVEDKTNWHGKPIGTAKSNELCEAIKKLIRDQELVNGTKRACDLVKIQEPSFKLEKNQINGDSLTFKLSKEPGYSKGQEVATRLAYGTALVNLGASNSQVVALDGDVKNSTYSIKFKEAYPDRFVECFIAEQNMVGVGIGCGTRNRTIPFISTFGAFLSRAYDQIRMGAISQSNIKLVGSHVGCSIGEDGPSQMALEDIACFRAIPNLVLFYPSDAVSTERAVELAANYPQMCYIRTSRPNTKVIYDNNEKFAIGQAKLVRACASDICTVVTGGVTLQEAFKAADQLEKESNGTKCLRIIDLFTIKPLDWKLIAEQAKQTSNRIVIVEDHYLEGGIGEAVSNLLAKNEPTTHFTYRHLYVQRIPKSATPEELMDKFGINARAIREAALSF